MIRLLSWYRRYLVSVAAGKDFMSSYDVGVQMLPWLLAPSSLVFFGVQLGGRGSVIASLCVVIAAALGGFGLVFVGWIFLTEEIRRIRDRGRR
jgi:hypothetical protein